MNHPKQPDPQVMDREIDAPDIVALPAIIRAEIDSAIATARAYPRSTAAFLRDVTELVTLDEEIAESCHYALPRKDKNGKAITIEGPSARFAELIGYAWGNNRGGGRVVSDEGGYVTAQGTFHDLEKNVQVTMEVRRSITGRSGRFSADMIGVTGNAAASIAHRNAVLKVIPKAIWSIPYQRALSVAVGDMETLGAKREKALAWFAKCGILPSQVFAKLGIAGLEDLGLKEYATLLGIKTAIKEGARPEEVFAEEVDEPDAKVTSFADRLAASRQQASQADARPPTTAETDAAVAAAAEALVDSNMIREALQRAETVDALDQAAADIGIIADADERAAVKALYESRRDSIELAAQ